MSKYALLNQEINFSHAQDRYCDLQFFSWDAVRIAKKEFEEWYEKKGTIYNVLKDFADEAERLVEKHIIIPLYKTLASDYEIYDISQSSYTEKCLDLTAAQNIHDEAIDIYEDIEEQLAEEKEYREFRKASRSEVIGGGFGIGGMIKGMATAGAINMATGVAHSIANSIGNAGSEGDANAKKTNLYNACRKEMANAIESCILATAYSHIYVVNERIPNHIDPSFDSEKAGALLESAKNISSKQEELLVESFKNCPWNYDIYSFIFKKYPQERRNLIEISKNFRVDLNDDITNLLRSTYTPEAKKSEDLAVLAKSKILTTMEELGVKESIVIDEIETDCLKRLCFGYEKATENTCNDLIKKVEGYDALAKNKTQFLKMLKNRIEEIWAKEDGEIFDNYLLNMDVLNPKEIDTGIKYIKKKGRTKEAKKYLEAFEMFKNTSTIDRARKYRHCVKQNLTAKLLKWAGALIGLLGLILYMSMDEFSFILHGLPIIFGIVIQIYLSSLESDWRKLTINNKAVHSILTMSNEEYNKHKKIHLDKMIKEAISKQQSKQQSEVENN